MLPHEQTVSSTRRERRRKHHSPRRTGLFVLEIVEGTLLLSLIVAAPWLFGCTEQWSITLMNCGSYALAALTLVRAFITRDDLDSKSRVERLFARTFLAANCLLLLFSLVALLNARAVFSIEQQTFIYRQNVISWLPTTYDQARSIQFLVNALAFFSIFWCTRSWLIRGVSESHSETTLNPRLKIILWVLTTNAFLLALQGLFQRLSNSSRLLWIRPSYWGTPESCFGPFSYRGNAVDYLNLVWPLSFGFWYVLAHQRERRKRFGISDGPELLLLPMFFITAAASFVTLSRGGSLVAALNLVFFAVPLLLSKLSARGKAGFAVLLLLISGFAFSLAGSQLIERFKTIFTDQFSGRTEIYQNARQIAADFPLFGTGPATFQSVYHLYRQSAKQEWAAYVHDDWLETRVTFGWVGFGLALLQLATLAMWVFSQRERWISPTLTLGLLLSLAGCLVHAKGDFPFQTYSIVLTFVVICAIATASTRRA